MTGSERGLRATEHSRCCEKGSRTGALRNEGLASQQVGWLVELVATVGEEGWELRAGISEKEGSWAGLGRSPRLLPPGLAAKRSTCRS